MCKSRRGDPENKKWTQKIDLENVKLNLEIIKLQEELKPHGYTFNAVEM